MKNLLLLLISLSVILISCGDDNEVSPTSPVIESTGALKPLAVGNEWVYLKEFKNESKSYSQEIRYLITEKENINYMDKQVSAYKEKHYVNDSLIDAVWYCEIDSILCSGLTLEQLESNLSSCDGFDNYLTFEEAALMQLDDSSEYNLKISVDTIEILGKSTKCIKFDTKLSNTPSEIYYKPGLGLVQEEINYLAPQITTTTLKSYTLK